MTPSRLAVQVGLRMAERAIRLECARNAPRGGNAGGWRCTVCGGTVPTCRCDHVRAWLIRAAARIGRRPNP